MFPLQDLLVTVEEEDTDKFADIVSTCSYHNYVFVSYTVAVYTVYRACIVYSTVIVSLT